MPVIPQYTQQIGVGGGDPTPRASGEQFSDAIGRSLSSFEKPLSELQHADMIQQRTQERLLAEQQEQDGKVWAGKTASDAQLQWDQHLKERQDAATGGAADFTPGILKDFDSYASETLKSAPTPQAKYFLQQHLTALRTSLGTSAIQFQAHAAVGNRLATHQQTIDTQAQIVAQDPGKYNQAMNLITETMPAVGPEGTQKLHDYALKSLNQAAAGSAIQTNPGATYDLLNKSLHPFSTPDGKPVQLPASGDPQFDSAVKDVGLPSRAEPLARAIFAQESSSGAADTSAPNYAGARGPMQVTQDTFEGLRKGGYIPATAKWDNPQDNTHAGLALIKYLDTKFGGDPKKVAAAYYSGERAVGPDGRILDYRDPQNPAVPSTLQYVEQVTGRAQRLVASASPDTVSAVATPGAVTAGAMQNDTVPVKTGVPWIDNMPVPDRLHYMQQAATEMQRGLGALQTDLKNKERDLQSMVLNGVAPPPTSVPTENDYVRAYGPAQGPAMYRDNVADVVQMGNGIRAMNAASPAERMAIISAATPTPGPNYDHQLRLQGALVKANDAIEKALAADPASYAMQNSPRVQTASNNLQSVMNNQQATEQQKRSAIDSFATEMMAEQTRLGVTSPDAPGKSFGTPRLLTNSQANQISQQFQTQPNGASNAVQLVQQLSRQWGANWPTVFAQLQPNLPPVAKVLGSMPDLDPATAELMARNGSVKPEELKTGIKSTQVKTVDDDLQSTMQDLKGTMSYQVGGQATFGTLYDAMQKLAYTYVGQGVAPSTAVTQAYQNVIGKRYNIEGQARIPKQYDVGAIMSGTKRIMTDLPKADLVLPPAPSGMRTEDVKKQYAAALPNNTVWLTNKDETGLILYDRVSGTPVRTTSGPVTATWNQLMTRGTEGEKPNAPVMPAGTASMFMAPGALPVGG